MTLAKDRIVYKGAPVSRQAFHDRLAHNLSKSPSIDQFGHRHYPIPGMQILQPPGSNRPNLDMYVIHPKESPFSLAQLPEIITNMEFGALIDYDNLELDPDESATHYARRNINGLDCAVLTFLGSILLPGHIRAAYSEALRSHHPKLITPTYVATPQSLIARDILGRVEINDYLKIEPLIDSFEVTREELIREGLWKNEGIEIDCLVEAGNFKEASSGLYICVDPITTDDEIFRPEDNGACFDFKPSK